MAGGIDQPKQAVRVRHLNLYQTLKLLPVVEEVEAVVVEDVGEELVTRVEKIPAKFSQTSVPLFYPSRI